MAGDDPRIPVNDFLVDCAETAMRLDAVGVRDDHGVIAASLARGQSDYDRLLSRQRTLWMTEAEASLIQRMMDRLLARLKFLEKRV